MREYLQLLKDFRDALLAGEYWKAYTILVKLQEAIVSLFGPGAVVTMSVEEKEEIGSLSSEINGILGNINVASGIGDGKIIAILIPIFRALLPILIGLEQPTA